MQENSTVSITNLIICTLPFCAVLSQTATVDQSTTVGWLKSDFGAPEFLGPHDFFAAWQFRNTHAPCSPRVARRTLCGRADDDDLIDPCGERKRARLLSGRQHAGTLGHCIPFHPAGRARLVQQ